MALKISTFARVEKDHSGNIYKFHGIWHSRQTPINPIRLLMKNPNIKQLPKCGKNAKTLKLEIGTQFLQPCTTKSRFTTICRVDQNILS